MTEAVSSPPPWSAGNESTRLHSPTGCPGRAAMASKSTLPPVAAVFTVMILSVASLPCRIRELARAAAHLQNPSVASAESVPSVDSVDFDRIPGRAPLCAAASPSSYPGRPATVPCRSRHVGRRNEITNEPGIRSQTAVAQSAGKTDDPQDGVPGPRFGNV